MRSLLNSFSSFPDEWGEGLVISCSCEVGLDFENDQVVATINRATKYTADNTDGCTIPVNHSEMMLRNKLRYRIDDKLKKNCHEYKKAQVKYQISFYIYLILFNDRPYVA